MTNQTTISTNQSTNSVRVATPKQIEAYKKICFDKGFMPHDTTNWTTQQASEAMQQMFSFYPMSKAQRDLLNTLQNEAFEIGLIPRLATDVMLSRISGTVAREKIQQLRERVAQNSHLLSPTDEQLNKIADMQICPDVDFDTWNVAITRVVEGDDGVLIGKRRLTRTEFVVELKQSGMSRKDASEFISTNQPKFYAWRSTLCTDAQVSHIQTLQRRIYNMSVSNIPQQQTADIYGDLNEDVAIDTDSRNTYWIVDDEAITPKEQLKLMTRDQANDYMRILNIEINAKTEVNRIEQDEIDELRRQQWSLEDSEMPNREETRKDVADFNDLLYALQSIGGYEVEEFQNLSARILFQAQNGEQTSEGTAEAKAELRNSIVDFIVLAYQSKSITGRGLVQMMDSSELGKELLLECAKLDGNLFKDLIFA